MLKMFAQYLVCGSGRPADCQTKGDAAYEVLKHQTRLWFSIQDALHLWFMHYLGSCFL